VEWAIIITANININTAIVHFGSSHAEDLWGADDIDCDKLVGPLFARCAPSVIGRGNYQTETKQAISVHK